MQKIYFAEIIPAENTDKTYYSGAILMKLFSQDKSCGY